MPCLKANIVLAEWWNIELPLFPYTQVLFPKNEILLNDRIVISKENVLEIWGKGHKNWD